MMKLSIKKNTFYRYNKETYFIPLQSITDIEREIESIFNFTYERLVKKNVYTKSVTIKIRYFFETFTRSKN